MKRLASTLLALSCSFAQNAPEAVPPASAATTASPAAQPPTAKLVDVKRVYVDALTGDDSAAAIRELLIASLQQSRLFALTDNPDRADAILKGAAKDTVFTDTFDSQEGLNAHANAGSYANRTSSNKGGNYAGVSVGENESHHIKERKHEAFATVRLCNSDGDVLWATTQESRGAKFRGASADVAEKVMRQLQLDFGKVQRSRDLLEAPPAVNPQRSVSNAPTR
jgi:hypothetical protein